MILSVEVWLIGFMCFRSKFITIFIVGLAFLFMAQYWQKYGVTPVIILKL